MLMDVEKWMLVIYQHQVYSTIWLKLQEAAATASASLLDADSDDAESDADIVIDRDTD